MQKPGVSEILSDSFNYWNRTLRFQLLYSLLYLSLFFFGYFYLFRWFGLWDEIIQHQDLAKTNFTAFNEKIKEIAQLPQMGSFALSVLVLLAIINPLNVGFYKIYHKLDLGEKTVTNDLFAGYLGFDFFRFFGFYLFWLIVFSYANSLLMLGILWVLVTVFSVPLIFFKRVPTFQSVALTVKALRGNLTVVLATIMIAFLFSLSGILLFGFGFLLTFPFWNAVIYSLYKRVFTEIK